MKFGISDAASASARMKKTANSKNKIPNKSQIQIEMFFFVVTENKTRLSTCRTHIYRAVHRQSLVTPPPPLSLSSSLSRSSAPPPRPLPVTRHFVKPSTCKIVNNFQRSKMLEQHRVMPLFFHIILWKCWSRIYINMFVYAHNDWIVRVRHRCLAVCGLQPFPPKIFDSNTRPQETKTRKKKHWSKKKRGMRKKSIGRTAVWLCETALSLFFHSFCNNEFVLMVCRPSYALLFEVHFLSHIQAARMAAAAAAMWWNEIGSFQSKWTKL